MEQEVRNMEDIDLQTDVDRLTAALAAVQKNQAKAIHMYLEQREALRLKFEAEDKDLRNALRGLGHSRRRSTEVAKKAAKRGRPKKTEQLAEGGGASGGT
ncbi:MAG TPA: hypothetical protein VJ180_09080 [Pyrinomonadaceae bacterium]|nr:hypothetical protein [Pyrinomonadaceae bacterium]